MNKGSVTASCGHELKDWEMLADIGFPVAYKDVDREGNDCVVYATYCFACYLRLVFAKELLDEQA